MSEKRARLERKNAAVEEETPKKSGSALLNWITAVLIIAFLGLGGYALKDNIKAILPERPEKETTIADLAKEKDMKADEFIAEYGLSDSDVTAKTTESEMLSKITVENYAKYKGQTADELLAEYEIEGANGEMLWQDAYMLIPMSKYAEDMGTTFEEFKEQVALPDEITEKTTLADAQRIVAEQSQAEEAEEETAEDEAE